MKPVGERNPPMEYSNPRTMMTSTAGPKGIWTEEEAVESGGESEPAYDLKKEGSCILRAMEIDGYFSKKEKPCPRVNLQAVEKREGSCNPG
jgi:hypothetical protein